MIFINESWTNGSITKAYLTIDGYELISREDRTDTSNGRGGGLLIYAKLGMIAEESEDIKSEFNQFASVRVSSKPVDLFIHLIYRSPNSLADNNNHLNELIRSSKKSSIFIGDMNYRHIDWETGSSSTAAGTNFLRATQDAFLTQYVDFPTHENNVIDLVLATNDVVISSVDNVGNLGKSHHSILHIKVNTNPTNSLSTQKVPDYSKADYGKMKLILSDIDWEDLFSKSDTHEAWDTFKKILTDCTEKCIPLKDRRGSDKPMWMNKNIMRAIRKKGDCGGILKLQLVILTI